MADDTSKRPEEPDEETRAATIRVAAEVAGVAVEQMTYQQAIAILDDPTRDPHEVKQVIIDALVKDDPRLNPDSPEFNAELWKAYTERTIQALKGNRERIQSALQAAARAVDMGKYISDATRGLRENLAGMVKGFAEVLTVAASLVEEFNELEPYLQTELKKKKYKGKTLDALIGEAAEDEESEALLEQALSAARKAREAAVKAGKAIVKPKKFDFPVDKPNSEIWRLLERDTAGQVEFNLAKRGAPKALAFYSVNFEEFENAKISKCLSMFDKFVYIAVAALYNAGNDVITATDIYYAMGNTTKPGDAARKKIDDAITKMMGAKISITNWHEARAQTRRKLFEYDGYLLPAERMRARVNGRLVESAIHLFREPPMITFARERDQITTFSINLLRAPISKTETNLKLQDYLLFRIGKGKHDDNNRKNPKKSMTILLGTLYDKIGVNKQPKNERERKERDRTPEKIAKCLQTYQAEKVISSFEIQSTKVIIWWD